MPEERHAVSAHDVAAYSAVRAYLDRRTRVSRCREAVEAVQAPVAARAQQEKRSRVDALDGAERHF